MWFAVSMGCSFWWVVIVVTHPCLTCQRRCTQVREDKENAVIFLILDMVANNRPFGAGAAYTVG